MMEDGGKIVHAPLWRFNLQLEMFIQLVVAIEVKYNRLVCRWPHSSNGRRRTKDWYGNGKVS